MNVFFVFGIYAFKSCHFLIENFEVGLVGFLCLCVKKNVIFPLEKFTLIISSFTYLS